MGIEQSKYNDLINQIGGLLQKGREQVAQSLYLTFPKSETLSNVLGWSHYFEILRSDNELEINFYTKQAEKENWSVRELKRQMKSMLFHRLALSKDKKGVLELSEVGQEIQKAEDILKDPYVLEFLNMPESHQFLESELEGKLISNLQHFLLELGKGFTFEKRQFCQPLILVLRQAG
ncbi:MAG: PDDEXK nuclease domain-containing protein [Flavobacteriales bacterium]|jgi:predicted nuclease of restriction endonuclease-like (RecB) superfamily